MGFETENSFEGVELTPSQSYWSDTKETIMIYGLPKHGKTYSYCSVIKHIIKSGGKTYIISTDSGFIRTAKVFFKEHLDKVKDDITIKPVYNINDIRQYYNEIKNKLKDNDLLVIDLLSDTYEWAQIAFAEEAAGGDITNFIIKAQKDKASFGLFTAVKWDYIKALNKFVEDIITRKPCNFVGVCDEKDTTSEIARGGDKAKEKLEDLGFDSMTTRPGGQKNWPYKFETIIRISSDDRGYFMQIVGDRGYKPQIRPVYYENDMYSKLIEWRSKQI